MPVNPETPNLSFGLLPEPSGRSASFITSMVVNVAILGGLLLLGMWIKPKLIEHTFEATTLVLPNTSPPPPKIKIAQPKLPDPPKIPEVKLELPKIVLPKLEPKPEKPIQMEAKLNAPVIKAPKAAVILAPQPKAALTLAAAPAQAPQAKVSTAPVHVGQLFGVTPNPNATRPAQVAAIGNPYGGMTGPATAPRGVVGSTGFGNGTKSGATSGVVGKVASAGIPTATTASTTNMGKVASTGIPGMTAVAVTPKTIAGPADTAVEVLSKPQPQYTNEAKLAKVQGDVVLRVTFTANGQVLVQSIVQGLGHGLDEEARRVTERIRFRPATHNGKPVDSTNNIRISFQLA
jgi:TonB family protein